MLYPLKFETIYKEHENLIISGSEDNASIVENGFLAGNDLNELLEIYMTELVGEHVYEKYGNTFPLCVKLIEAEEDLPIQVLAAPEADRPNYGKLWYVLDAAPEGQVMAGFSKTINKETLQQHVSDDTLTNVMQWYNIAKGDVLFIQAGQVHAIGKGVTMLEIQEVSGMYFDVNSEEALEVIDFENKNDVKIAFEHNKNQLNAVITNEYFTANHIKLDNEINRDYYTFDSFVIYLCVSGQCTIHYDEGSESLAKGEIKLSPKGQTEIIEVLNQKLKEHSDQ